MYMKKHNKTILFITLAVLLSGIYACGIITNETPSGSNQEVINDLTAEPFAQSVEPELVTEPLPERKTSGFICVHPHDIPPDEILSPYAEKIYGMSYDELEVEFENNIELAKQEDLCGWDVFIYQSKAHMIFQKMLNHRQSLEYFSESIEFMHIAWNGHSMSIDIGPIFTHDNITYRILHFSGHRFINRTIYIQIYDDEFIASMHVYDYMVEGGTFGEIIHIGFVQDSDKVYLIIVHREDNACGYATYYLVNYKINGKEITKYRAFGEEITKGIWNIGGSRPFEDKTNIRVSYYGIDYVLLIMDFTEETFEENILTITLNNEAQNEISLQFKNGLWEVIAAN